MSSKIIFIVSCILLAISFIYFDLELNVSRKNEFETMNISLINQVDTLKRQLDRDDKLFSMLLDKWNRFSPVFSKDVTVTCYTSRRKETDSTPWTTASNKKVRPGTLAVSQDLLPIIGGFGKEVIIAGYGSFTVTDVMNKRFKNSVDIWAGDLKAAMLHGRKTAKLIWQ